MTQFTEAEEAFIEASVPVLQAGEREREAHVEFELVSDRAAKVGEEQLGEKSKDVAYMHGLLLAAAERAGYGPDSTVVEAINAAYEDILQYLRLLEQLAEESQRVEARGLVLGTDGQPIV
ncbi:MAG: hypothetical protein ACXVHB_05795 [Solirubrobacteraceae bacterium]